MTNYKTIKWVLRSHIKNNAPTLWTWENNDFTCIYKNFDGDKRIYTAQQLLNKIDNEIHLQKMPKAKGDN